MAGLQNNKTVEILSAAAQDGYGVLAATSFTLEHILAVVKAAERKRSPLIIQLFPWAIQYSNGLLVHAAAKAAAQASVPISIHLDHCQDEELVKKACELPFDSIMVDMSHHSKEENLAKTRELVAYCHSKGKGTEAEPGRIEGGEDGIPSSADLTGILTTDEEVVNFAGAGVDCLAPAFGNVHGKYGPRGVVLEWDRLAKIHELSLSSGVLLALHGVDHFPDDLLHRLIKSGISKVNINNDLSFKYYEHLEKNVNKMPFTKLLEEGVEIMVKNVERLMDVVLSSGRA